MKRFVHLVFLAAAACLAVFFLGHSTRQAAADGCSHSEITLRSDQVGKLLMERLARPEHFDQLSEGVLQRAAKQAETQKTAGNSAGHCQALEDWIRLLQG